MPLYFFHLNDGRAVADEDGVELHSIDAARVIAAEFFGAAIRDAGLAFFEDHDWRLEVTDDRGLVLFVAAAFVQDAATSRTQVSEKRYAAG